MLAYNAPSWIQPNSQQIGQRAFSEQAILQQWTTRVSSLAKAKFPLLKLLWLKLCKISF